MGFVQSGQNKYSKHELIFLSLNTLSAPTEISLKIYKCKCELSR